MPEYNSGAMENVGCVTYNEAYLFRDPPTDNERLDRAETFLHELAHMWFGNLVTMRWWNDLWLNESFATYISYLAHDRGDALPQCVEGLQLPNQALGLPEDQLPTTHPIAGTAADTEIAFLNFDGITYGKGASVLKQLAKYIGPDAFRDGLRLYFSRHAWGNATLDDFLACLEEAQRRATARVVRACGCAPRRSTPIAAKWQAADGNDRPIWPSSRRAPTDYPTLRPHALEIALGQERLERAAQIESVPAWIEGARTDIPELRGRAAPASSSPTTATTPMPRSRSTQRRSTSCAPASTASRTRCCASCCGCRCGRWCATASCARPSTSPSRAISSAPSRTATSSTWP